MAWRIGGNLSDSAGANKAAGLPSFLGVSSENAAHRMAVFWEDDEGTNAGGGVYSAAGHGFGAEPTGGRQGFSGRTPCGAISGGEPKVTRINLEMKSKDGEVAVQVRGKGRPELPADSRFAKLAEASGFFEPGSLGYSVDRRCSATGWH